MLLDEEEDDKTISIMEVDESLERQLDQMLGGNMGNDSLMTGSFPTSTGDDDKTVSFGFWGDKRQPPVTGWLVCLTGDEKGQDYRLHSGKNFIGRGYGMDISLISETTISLGKHCSLAYDPKGNGFYLSPEEGNVVYQNGEMAGEGTRLEEGDIITVGETKLVFIPYCREDRKWEEE